MKKILQLTYNGGPDAGKRMLEKMHPHVAGVLGLASEKIYEQVQCCSEACGSIEVKILKPLHGRGIASVLCDHGFKEKEL